MGDTKESKRRFGYDGLSRLTSDSTASTTFAYDGDGLRMSKTAGGVVEPFAWDLDEGLPLLLADGGIEYVTGPGGLPLAQNSPNRAAVG